MGKLIECGERTVQTKDRISIHDIALKHDIKPGDVLNVRIQKVTESEGLDDIEVGGVQHVLEYNINCLRDMNIIIKHMEEGNPTPDNLKSLFKSMKKFIHAMRGMNGLYIRED